MSNTLPNVIVPPKTVVDLYAETGITVGVQIAIEMKGTGEGRLYSGAALTQRPDDTTGYTDIKPDNEMFNDADDLGAFIWSDYGCTVNVGEY